MGARVAGALTSPERSHRRSDPEYPCSGSRPTLAQWLTRNVAEVDWLRTFRERTGPHDSAPIEDLWRLYALGRVIQLLTLSYQTGSADGSAWAGPGIPLGDFCTFAGDLGLTVSIPERFSPFDCEIVTATVAVDRDAPPSLTAIHWPCLMLGDMLVCRAGTSIRAGANVVDAPIATTSTLYWAYRRKTRPYQDLSHGWGGNSQWRTSFRRDYRASRSLHFNVDGKHDLAAQDLEVDEEVPLTREERVEVLTHRCFVSTPTLSGDLFPYDDKLTLQT